MHWKKKKSLEETVKWLLYDYRLGHKLKTYRHRRGRGWSLCWHSVLFSGRSQWFIWLGVCLALCYYSFELLQLFILYPKLVLHFQFLGIYPSLLKNNTNFKSKPLKNQTWQAWMGNTGFGQQHRYTCSIYSIDNTNKQQTYQKTGPTLVEYIKINGYVRNQTLFF